MLLHLGKKFVVTSGCWWLYRKDAYLGDCAPVFAILGSDRDHPNVPIVAVEDLGNTAVEPPKRREIFVLQQYHRADTDVIPQTSPFRAGMEAREVLGTPTLPDVTNEFL